MRGEIIELFIIKQIKLGTEADTNINIININSCFFDRGVRLQRLLADNQCLMTRRLFATVFCESSA